MDEMGRAISCIAKAVDRRGPRTDDQLATC